ncbi:LysM peptidoglycan-binding domain-containing protein, partial [bacterium]|nr:LysM peptidoglycan-binding domain-containing protein [bacterium]
DVAFESLAALSLDRILKGQQVYIVEQLLQFGDHNLGHGELTNIIEEVYQNSTNGYSFSRASRDDFEASQELSVALEFIGHVKKEGDQSALKVELESAFELAQQLHQSENEFYATLGGSVLDSLRTLSAAFPTEEEHENPANELTPTPYTDLSDLYAKLVRPNRHDFDFDPDNRYIKRQLRMLLTKRRRELDQWLTRITYYIPEQREIFNRYKLPQDLVFLSVIESGLNPRAYSRAAAKGMWQFIYSTGKLYGLKRTYWKEERYDPVLAGQAAARHLRDLYDQFRDWELAIAAYNSGAGRVLSAIRRGRSRNFWKIRRYLPRETRDYVPIFYAMLSILKNPREYGIRRVQHVEPIQYDVVTLPEATDLQVLAQCARSSVKELRHLNPSLRRNTSPPEKDFAFRVPKGSGATFKAKYAALDVSQRRLASSTHRVKHGETLFDIALAYGMDHKQLAALNNMGNSRTIYPDQVLKVPANSGRRLASANLDPNRYEKLLYTVQSGDTLSEIAEYKFKTRASQLRRWNDLSYYDKIYPGQKLVVWVKK